MKKEDGCILFPDPPSKMITLFSFLLFAGARGEILTEKEHKTQAAVDRSKQLACFSCHTMEEGTPCANISTNATSPFNKTCFNETICMVKRYSFTSSTEDTTSAIKMWSLERSCAQKCEPGCIIIGERTKLYACTTCCETSLCNRGRGGATGVRSNHLPLVALVALVTILNHCPLQTVPFASPDLMIS